MIFSQYLNCIKLKKKEKIYIIILIIKNNFRNNKKKLVIKYLQNEIKLKEKLRKKTETHF